MGCEHGREQATVKMVVSLFAKWMNYFFLFVIVDFFFLNMFLYQVQARNVERVTEDVLKEMLTNPECHKKKGKC